MSIPKDFEDFFNKGQSLRNTAMHAQLLALEGQVKAIKAIDLEHSLGIESSREAEQLYNHSRDLVKSAESIAAGIRRASKDSTLNALHALRDTAKRLSERAAALDKGGLDRARARLDQCLAEHASVHAEDVQGIVPTGCEGLAVKAGVSCYRAESEQFDTFALQVKALCDLVQEYAYTAAKDSPQFANVEPPRSK